MPHKDYFTVLGVKPGATEDEIKKSYRTLAKKWHPDKNSEPGAEEKFKEISAAYDYLKSKDRREILERDIAKENEPKPKSTAKNSYTYSTGTYAKPSASTHSGYTGYSDTNYTGYSYEPSYSSRTDNTEKQDDKPKKPKKKKPHWTDSFKHREEKKQSKPSTPEWKSNWKSSEKREEEKYWNSKSKPYSDPWDDDFMEDTFSRGSTPEPTFASGPSYSSAFRTFCENLDSEFDTFFANTTFGDVNSGVGGFTFINLDGGTRKKYPFGSVPFANRAKHKARNVAQEKGNVDDLNNEYMFSERKNAESEEPTYSSEEEFVSDEDHYRCMYCAKRFLFSDLKDHEPACGRKARKGFPTHESMSFGNDDMGSTFTSERKSNWRTRHEDLINNIRRAKKAHRGSMDYGNVSGSSYCKYCGKFVDEAETLSHMQECDISFRSESSAKKESKNKRAKEYADKIRKPKTTFKFKDASSTRSSPSPNKPTARSTDSPGTFFPDINETNSGVYSRRNSYGATSPADRTRAPKQTPRFTGGQNSRAKYPPSYFGVRGETVGATNSGGVGEGCATCQKTFGKHARFNCSCGIKTAGVV